MARKRRKEECKGGASWLTTYGDMVTLLLTFFALLLSFSSMETRKFESAIGSLRGALGITSSVMSMSPTQNVIQFPSHGGMTSPAESDVEAEIAEIAQALEVVVEELQEMQEQMQEKQMQQIEAALQDENFAEAEEMMEQLEAMQMDDAFELIPVDEGIRITLKSELLFDSGSGSLRPDFFPILSQISKLTGNTDNTIIVEGHTDDRPMSSAAYPSNWELSAARASSVIRYMTEVNNVDPDRFVLKAYGEFRPIASNETRAGRAKNRRIEIFIKNRKETEITL